MGFIVLVLVIGTLIAAIWGRSVAQGFVAVVLGGAAVLLGGLVLLVGVLLVITPSTNMSRAHGAWDAPPPGRNPFSTTPRPYYAPPAESADNSSSAPANASSAPTNPAPVVTPAVPSPLNIVRPQVGIAMRPLTLGEDMAIGLRPGIGQCVTYVAPGSGAAAANVIPGDEITKVYVRNTWYWVATQGTVTQAVEASPAGSWTWMEMLRNGRIYRVRLQSAACVVRRQ